VPVVVSGVSDAAQVSVSGSEACALLRDGRIACWGSNGEGELGDGAATSSSGAPRGPQRCESGLIACSRTPVFVHGISDAVQVVAGADQQACALRRSGRVVCWGSEAAAGACACSTRPLPMAGVGDAVQLTAGGPGWCALRAEGTIVCWAQTVFGENNALGQFGDGARAVSLTPVVVSGINDATQLAGDALGACAVLATGRVECWGDNGEGELGDGSTDGPQHCTAPSALFDLPGPPLRSPCSRTPVAVAGITDATALAAGDSDVCALHAGGTVACWGAGGSQPNCAPYGNSCSPAPVPVSGIANAEEIAVGEQSCAALASGAIDCWTPGQPTDAGSAPAQIAPPD
jgi:alpha-tubulin suppressor-like RCC1 family protein